MIVLWFLVCAVIGYLLVLALPDRGSADVGSFRSRDLPEL